MTKEVSIMIEGIQFGAEDDSVTTKATGEYYYRNGKHFIQYNEKPLGSDFIIKNRVKIARNQVEITKCEKQKTNMVFIRGEKTTSNYHTPYGCFVLGFKTIVLNVVEEKNDIQVKLQYALEVNGEYVSKHYIDIIISSIYS